MLVLVLVLVDPRRRLDRILLNEALYAPVGINKAHPPVLERLPLDAHVCCVPQHPPRPHLFHVLARSGAGCRGLLKRIVVGRRRLWALLKGW